jgi:hypothetical protein
MQCGCACGANDNTSVYIFLTYLYMTTWFVMKGWSWLENKITVHQWKIAKTNYTPFQMILFYLFWLCPATFGNFPPDENSWNQLNSWKISSLVIVLSRLCGKCTQLESDISWVGARVISNSKDWLSAKYAALWRKGKDWLSAKYAALWRKWKDWLSAKHGASWRKGKDWLSAKHAALWRKGKDWLSAKHAALWRKGKDWLFAKHAALWRKGKDWLSAKHAALWRKGNDWLSAKHAALWGKGKDRSSAKHAALWRKGKDWLSAKHAALWRKRLIVWVSGYCVLVERYVCLPADCWFIGLALWTVPDLPLCLGVLDHRAPLARGPFFLPKNLLTMMVQF